MISVESIASARYGAQAPCGLYVASVLADMDFETYSEAGFVWHEDEGKWKGPPGAPKGKRGLSVVGVSVYVEHPTFEVLSLKYDLKDGAGVRTWIPGQPNPQLLFDHVAAGLLIEAHNAGFEMAVWGRCVDLYGWPEVPFDRFRCSAAKARAASLPGALDKAAAVLGTTRKDPKGDVLLRRLSVPQAPTKASPFRRLTPQTSPALFEQLYAYNETDIVAEAHLSANVPDLSPIELEHWQIDQLINRRGVHINEPVLRGAAQIIRQAERAYGVEVQQITGGIKPTELKQLKDWCADQGVTLPAMDEAAVDAALADPSLPPLVRRVLELRALVGSASVKKTFAMLNQVNRDGRLTHLYVFHGAHTGRPTGSGPQPTNLPKAGPDVVRCECGRHHGAHTSQCPWCLRPSFGKIRPWNPEAMLDAMALVSIGNLTLLEWFFGEALRTVAGCLRGSFNAAPGHVLVSSDYTAIEAVALSCLSGEQWRIDLFKNKGKIYEASGALVAGLEYDDVIAYAEEHGHHHPCRQDGKVLELASGYGGWINAWRQFDNNPDTPDAHIKKSMGEWRKKCPAIVEFWGGQSRRVGFDLYEPEFFGVEGAFIQARLNPGQWFSVGHYVHMIGQGDTVYIRLPSGRFLTYRNVTLRPSDRRGNQYDISYWGWNTNQKNGPVGKWIEMRTWGGKIVENITQAVCNCILRFALVNLERRGYPTVMHTYDEIVAEVPIGFGSVAEFEDIMQTLPLDWAVLPDGSPWPIYAAGGWMQPEYRKE